MYSFSQIQKDGKFDNWEKSAEKEERMKRAGMERVMWLWLAIFIVLEVVDVKSAKSQRLPHIFLAKHSVCPHVDYFAPKIGFGFFFSFFLGYQSSYSPHTLSTPTPENTKTHENFESEKRDCEKLCGLRCDGVWWGCRASIRGRRAASER